MKKLAGIILAGAMVMALVGCGKKEEAAVDNKAEKGNEDLKEITLVLDWTPNTNHTGFYVAQNEGYFEEEGLKVNIVQPPEDGATTMVASGQAEFGIDFQDYLPPVFTSEEKIPVEVVAALIQHNTSGIISLKEDNINSPKDLEGKNYATWDLPIEKAMMQNIVEADGGDFSKVNLIPEYVENEAAALQQDIDAIWVYYAWAGISTKQAGLDTNMIYFKDITPEFDFYSPVIVSNSDWLAENEDTAKAFLRAVKKGYEFSIDNPDKAAEILVKQVPELSLDLVKESQEWLSPQYKAEVEQWGYIDQTRWDSFYKWLSDNGLSEEIPEGYGFTNKYLPE
ncbi:MAG: ABC transporter substrate-binding protein [Lachnospiraceae bacterium]|jgi:ABC-type nitrate/sulfonate/bicarbonate transport system substrate-binding protein|nr:ABC transporter substrate-binding protein [Lachnospiraceae bacterium]